MKLTQLFLLLIFISFSYADIIIVTNKNSQIKKLSKETIKYLYLAKVNNIKNITIRPLLSKNEKLHNKFINNIIEKDIHQYASYWARLVFTGKKAIPRRLSFKELERELEKLNTIIYIEKQQLKNNWKIVYEQ